MSNLSCPVCTSDRPGHYLALQTSTGKVPYFKCPDCSLVFQDPDFPFVAEEIYNADYIQKRSQDPGDLNTSIPRERTAEYYYRWLKKYVPPKGNLLEVGCATGISLKVARGHGWKVYGVEVNGSAAMIAKNILKEDVVRVGHLNDAMFPDGFFSLVTLFDVIEHIPHPMEFMATLHKKIAPGGSIFFLTPNIDTASFRMLREKWPHFVAEHLLLYSPRSLDRLLKESGFKLRSHGWARKYLSIGMLKTHAENHPNGLIYKPVSRVLGASPALAKAVIPFNLGEMYVLAEKTS
jgi:2-polyprenyl-3-methyl-5-hydroxy-6-metoxy-1,4-benzoquinol methylase